ncbi:MAG: hypothetical protein QXQ02_02705 [Halobacteria archaeon]
MAIKHYQVPLNEEKMRKLKIVTGEKTAKGALAKAVELCITQIAEKQRMKAEIKTKKVKAKAKKIKIKTA